MACGCWLQTIKRLSRHRHRRIKAHGEIRHRKIVVDGLRDTDEIQATLVRQPRHDPETAIAANPDERIDLQCLERVDQLGRAVLDLAIGHRVFERVLGIGRTKNRPAPAQDKAVEILRRQFTHRDRLLQQAGGAVFDPQHLPAKAMRPVHNSAHHGVKACAVAAAGQYCYPFCH